MKKTFAIVLMICLLLSGCGKAPAKDAAGNPWGSGWTMVGSVLGVEAQKDWTLRRGEDVLAAEGMFYYVWTKGEAVTSTNDSGETVTAYPAEIHLVLVETPSAGDAQSTAQQWDQLTQERYPEAEESAAVIAGQDFALSTYPNGASATGLRGTNAIRVDVITLGDEDAESILTDFLNTCHYAA